MFQYLDASGCKIKRKAGRELAYIWELKLNKSVEEYAPLLGIAGSQEDVKPVFAP